MKVCVKHFTWCHYIQFHCQLDDDNAPQVSDFTVHPGCTQTGSFQNPVDCFSLFFSDEVWQFLVDNTNQYATEKLRNKHVSTTCPQ